MKFPAWWLSKAEDGSTASIEFIELDETELDPERDWSVAAESDERRVGVVMNAHGLAVLLDFLSGLAPAEEAATDGWQFIDDGARLARLIANEEVVTEVARAGGRILVRRVAGQPALDWTTLLETIIEASFDSRTDAALRLAASKRLDALSVVDAAVAIRSCLEFDWGATGHMDDIPSYFLEDVRDQRYLDSLSSAQRFVLDAWVENVRDGGHEYWETHFPRAVWGVGQIAREEYRRRLREDIDAWLAETPGNPAVTRARELLARDEAGDAIDL